MSLGFDAPTEAAKCASAEKVLPTSIPLGRKKTVLIALLLGVLSCALFLPTLNYKFLNYDDGPYVFENEHVAHGLNWTGLQYAATTRTMAGWTPLTWISYQLDTTLLGFHACSFHATNVILHSLAGVLLFLALLRLRLSLWVSVTVAGLFLVHPLRCESVAWIAERKDVLCAFFWMLGLLAYAFYAERRTGLRWALVFGAFVAGLMSKMMMVTFPFALLLLDFWPLQRLAFGDPAWRKRTASLILEKIPFLVVGAASVLATSAALTSRGDFNPEQQPLLTTLGRVSENYLFYLSKTFWPADLSVLYPLQGVQAATATLCAMSLLALTALVFWQRRKVPALAVGWFWFLGVLVPVIGFLPFSHFTVADRYSYLPSVGLLLACAVAGERLLKNRPRTQWAITAALTGLCLVTTASSLPRWHDSIALFDAALKVGPHPISYQNRGVALSEAGQQEAALLDFDAALRLNPAHAETRINRAKSLARLNRYEEAVQECEKAVALKPKQALACFELGSIHLQADKFAEAIREFTRGLALQPDNALGHHNRAVAHFRLQHFAEAARDLEKCQQLGLTPHPELWQAVAQAIGAVAIKN
jgi:protein O-mannosyl-transferase